MYFRKILFLSSSTRLLAVLVLFLLSMSPVAGQLSGRYTIGGVSPDYRHIGEAVAALDAEGVSGPVTFMIRPGRYFSQQILRRVRGASRSNTITFRSESGNADDVTLTSTARYYHDNFVLKFDNARHYRFEGVTILAESTEFIGAIKIVNLAYDIRIEKCLIFARTARYTDFYESAIYIGTTKSNNIYIRDNEIYGGTNGIAFLGGGDAYSADTQITGNKIVGFYRSGAIVKNVLGGQFTGNTITHNRMYSYAKGLVIDKWNGSIYHPTLIANNFVSILHSRDPAVEIYNSKYLNLYHNSLNHEKGALLLKMADVQRVAVLNNILRTGSGIVADIQRATSITMDYNDLYCSSGFRARWEGRTAASLYQWQSITRQDGHSISINPKFVSLTDLHAGAYELINAGTAVASVSTDIDGQHRSYSSCIGADEFQWYFFIPGWYGIYKSQSTEPSPGSAGEDAYTEHVGADIGIQERSVFPSPVSDRLNVALTDKYTGPVKLTVLDGLGRRVSTVSYEKQGDDLNAEIAVTNLSPGVYLLHIEEGKEVSVKRFVKR